MVGYIISLIAVFLFGIIVGVLISLFRSLKELNELDDDLKDIIVRYEKQIERAEALIKNYKTLSETREHLNNLYTQVISTVYMRLVDARDGGYDYTDEVIGYLGQVLGDDSDDGNCECEIHENHCDCTEDCACNTKEEISE